MLCGSHCPPSPCKPAEFGTSMRCAVAQRDPEATLCGFGASTCRFAESRKTAKRTSPSNGPTCKRFAMLDWSHARILPMATQSPGCPRKLTHRVSRFSASAKRFHLRQTSYFCDVSRFSARSPGQSLTPHYILVPPDAGRWVPDPPEGVKENPRASNSPWGGRKRLPSRPPNQTSNLVGGVPTPSGRACTAF